MNNSFVCQINAFIEFLLFHVTDTGLPTKDATSAATKNFSNVTSLNVFSS